MKKYREIADLDPPHRGVNGERFAVIEIDPSQRAEGGCRATVISLHHDRDAAERERHA